ncbi:FAD-dependent oxidoreductase [Candidatus Hodgkinia cicadicola]
MQNSRWSERQPNKREYELCKLLKYTILTMGCYTTLTKTNVRSLIKLNLNKQGFQAMHVYRRQRFKIWLQAPKLVIEANDMSTSGLLEVQTQALKLIISFKTAKVLKPGRVIEHNVISSKDVGTTTEIAVVPNAFATGWTNATTCYEEAGAQTHIAGVTLFLYRCASTPQLLDKWTREC